MVGLSADLPNGKREWDDLAIGEVLIHRESWDRADRVTHSDAGDVAAYGVDGAGGFVPEARRVRHGLDVLVIAPHRLGAVETDRLDLDANLSRARNCDLFIDEFEDFRPPAFANLMVRDMAFSFDE